MNPGSSFVAPLGSRLVPNLRSRFDELLRRLAEISDLERVGFLLSWDEETKMPPLGAPARAEQRATLARLVHELATAPELGALFDELREFEESHEPDSFEASVIRVCRRDYEKQRRVPSSLRAEMVRAGSLAYRAWLDARAASDFEIFRPHLERRLALVHEYVACHEPYEDAYDVLLDDEEPGMQTSDVEAMFARLKEELVPLVGGIGEPVDDACLHGDFPPDRQREFTLALLSRWGLDARGWRLDDTVHPFATALSTADIRLTTHFFADNLMGIVSGLHEFGHGLYDHQIDPRYARSFASNASGRSAGATSPASISRSSSKRRTMWSGYVTSSASTRMTPGATRLSARWNCCSGTAASCSGSASWSRG